MKISDLIEKYKYHEMLSPEVFSELGTDFDVDYFPQGNDPFMLALTESIKETVREHIIKN